MIAWSGPEEARLLFETRGANRRVPVDFHGLRLVVFRPEAAVPQEPGPPAQPGR